MISIGQFIKQKRTAKELTLRKFCEKSNLDPSNWSKIERGLLEGPKSEKVLREIAEVLEMNDNEFLEMKDLAIIESIPRDLISDKKILEALPVFFRTVRDLKPSKSDLKNLIQILKNT